MSNTPLRLIRYLFVLEVTASLVRLPGWPAGDLVRLLGRTIADQLPMAQARPWKKKMAEAPSTAATGRGKKRQVPESPWPIDAVVLWYPAKQVYGTGERILFELKMVGRSADHGFFLEAVLPAMETLSSSPASEKGAVNQLWGHFNIRSVYTARGAQWKPLIQNGRLDLRAKVMPDQWHKGLKYRGVQHPVAIRWITPVLLHPAEGTVAGAKGSDVNPTPERLMYALLSRLDAAVSDRHPQAGAALDLLDAHARAEWSRALADAAAIRIRSSRKIGDRPDFMGAHAMVQKLSGPISPAMLPFLELGALFHVGRYTHYGCGSLTLF